PGPSLTRVPGGPTGRNGLPPMAADKFRRVSPEAANSRPSRMRPVHTSRCAMLDAANYSAVETLRDGRQGEIRAFRPSDRADLPPAVARTSTESLYRRFFTVKRSFSEREKEFFLNVDFIDHVALMAWIEESARSVITGGGRYVVVQPGKAEVAFMIVDRYQGLG